MSRYPLQRLKHSTSLQTMRSDGRLPYVGLEHTSSWTGQVIPQHDDGCFQIGSSNLFFKGQVLFGKLRPYLAKGFIAERDGSCSSEFLVLQPHAYCSRFLLYWLLSSDFIDEVNSSTYGVKMPRASWEFVGNIRSPLPPFSTQIAIADYLDRKTAFINSIIEKKQRLLALLEEKRAALINRAVTRGLNPDVPMKDSGVPWIGEIPTHWDVKRARFLFHQEARPPLPDEGVVTAFRDGQVTLRENRRTEGFTFAVKETGYQRVCEGDLVIHSMDAFAGAIGVSESNGKCTPEYAVCNPFEPRMSNTYYAHLLRLMAHRNYIFVICPSVRERAPRFRFIRFRDVRLPVPPSEEQHAIVSYLNRKIAATDSIIKKETRLIKLLQERRQALITAAVTGKIDVRGEEA